MKIRNILVSAFMAACMLTCAGCAGNGSQSDAITQEDGNIVDVVLNEGDLIAEFNIEGYGTIKAKLFPEIAPKGVDNFVKLADSGYYDGLTIHRVMSDFMFQGGSLNGDGTGGEAADGGSFEVERNEYARHFYGALCYANAMGQNSTQFYIINNNTPTELSEKTITTFEGNAEYYKQVQQYYDKDSAEYGYCQVYIDYYSTGAEWMKNASDDVKNKYREVGGTPSLDAGYTVFGQVYEGFDVIELISACEVEPNQSGEMSKPVETITINSVKVTEYKK